MSLGTERRGGDPQPTIDARSMLAQWYGNEAIYVDTIQNGIGELTVTAQHCQQPALSFEIVDMPQPQHLRSVLVVNPTHMPGHFANNLGLVLPAHQRLRIAKETLHVATGRDIRIDNFLSAKFPGTVFPGDLLTTNVEIEEADDIGVSARVVSTIGNGKEVMVVEGLYAAYDTDPQETPRMEESQLIEALIQAAGMQALARLDMQSRQQLIPVFIDIGAAQFRRGVNISEGAKIQLMPDLLQQERATRILANGVIHCNNQSIGTVNGMRAIMMPTSRIFGK